MNTTLLNFEDLKKKKLNVECKQTTPWLRDFRQLYQFLFKNILTEILS